MRRLPIHTLGPLRWLPCLLLLTPAQAWAAGVGATDRVEPADDAESASVGGEASGSVSLDGASGSAEGATRASEGGHPLLRHRPRETVAEIGLYGGLFFPATQHSFQGPGATWKPLNTVLGSLGGRLGFYPLQWMGFEFEGGGFPGGVDGGSYVQLYHVRGHVLFQLPYRFTPFLLAGPGVLMVNSDSADLGVDPDPAAHLGAGARFYVNDWFNLRLEWRGTFAPDRDPGTGSASVLHNELLLGVGFVFGPKRAEAQTVRYEMPPDSDGDGYLDPIDRCPHEVGVSPAGCPDPDRDRDGVLNEADACPDEPGEEPDGCPLRDKDRDGFTDDRDACPTEPGLEPDGCPITDRDKDQILDPDDKCPDEPETRNGYQDTDGCPDEVPKEVEKFTGVIRGIYFDLDKATIQRKSHRVLNQAVEVLKKFPQIRLEIVGHTDATGTEAHNRELSQKRAEAVRQYLIDKGIEADRLVARGAGEDEPIASNETPTGRAENRRTEFNIISE